MSVTVKFFASLREQVGCDEKRLEVDRPLSVAQVWTAATGEAQRPGHLLSAVNLDYVDAGHTVRDGDEVAFFPPVTGG